MYKVGWNEMVSEELRKKSSKDWKDKTYLYNAFSDRSCDGPI
jgi:hypothetical protein